MNKYLANESPSSLCSPREKPCVVSKEIDGVTDMPHQVIDSGLDETSCFFIDDDGQEVTHGHYYEELGLKPLPPSYPSSYYYFTWYTSTYFSSSWTTHSPTSSPSSSTHSTTQSSSSSTFPTSSPSSSSYSPTSSPSSSYYYATGSSSTPSSTSSDSVVEVFEGGDFSFYPDRRKVGDHASARLYRQD